MFNLIPTCINYMTFSIYFKYVIANKSVGFIVSHSLEINV